ncbi:hypothetical protein [Photobacterium damselae]|uniref:Uncharacterized protein n=1 Tax=Photobacterium damselae TaxID=38293 RepID=A0ABD6WZJ0_PHODM|nr:hypothetical protein [Photobacterium damselae]OBU38737.1 hypothetical protein AYY27_11215 [Photobacterium damselae]PSU15258.1 hypothetical protein CTM90_17385 [Photobacterium damselae]
MNIPSLASFRTELSDPDIFTHRILTSSEIEQLTNPIAPITPINAITQTIRSITYKSIKEEHKQYRDEIYQSVLRHSEIREYIKIHHPITDALKRAITSIVLVIYGGHVSYLNKRPLIDKVANIAKELVQFSNGQCIKLGALITYMKDHLSIDYVLPSVSIVRKALTYLVPESILTLGRSCKSAQTLLKAFFKKNPHLV